MLMKHVPWELLSKFTATRPQLLDETRNWFKLVKGNSRHAICEAKQTLKSGTECTLEEGLAIEAKAFGCIFQTEDMVEGTAAFLEKRKATFKGKYV
ncbi:MAG: enoyl-CoA hydratase-related protein [Chitinophagaceae bacterium]